MPDVGQTTTGQQLDQDHRPETNGRMSVCRRCGSRTDGPDGGHHVPAERQLASVRGWLAAERTRSQIKKVNDARPA